MNYTSLFALYKQEKIFGRYITNEHIKPILESLDKDIFHISVLGKSVLNKPIYGVQVGVGKTKILVWSQMHGNESTTTKAVMDIINYLSSNDIYALQFSEFFTFLFIPVLNPDGAEYYTRENANKVDLNRDSVNLTQPESQILRETFTSFKPDFCYNMHDQRTIFGVSGALNPATVSFLSPAYNENREINEIRQKAINIIAAVNTELNKEIPGQISRFSDDFNINCIGDMFQSLGVPTILIEAGHYKNDYIREYTRKFVFIAILSSFNAIFQGLEVVNKSAEYFNIPQNIPVFYDFIYRNVRINYENKDIITNFASHYKEELFENSIIFNSYIKEIGDLSHYKGHIEYECSGGLFSSGEDLYPVIGKKADFSIGSIKYINGIAQK